MVMENVLVIDDDVSNRSVLSKVLVRYGYQVKDAPDGEEGIELLKNSGQYKAVITDIRMPKKNGNDVAKYVRYNLNMKDTIVVGISGTLEDAEKEFFDYLISKPYKIKDIIEIISPLQ